MRKKVFLLAVLLALLLGAAAASPTVRAAAFPDIIPLPDGWQPEGVVAGRGPVVYAGSLANGAIYAANLRTGAGSVLVPGVEGRVTVGLGFDARTNYIFAAGGPTGEAYVFDASSGTLVATYSLTAPGGFVNDVIVTQDAAYFTNSFAPEMYRLPLGPGGSLPDPADVETIPLGGEYSFIPGGFNANGIEATPNGKQLIIVNSTVGALYLVDPETGYATEIALSGGSVSSGDGLLLSGHTLYVVQNFLNRIAVVELGPQYSSGEIVGYITDSAFDIPTTVAGFGSRLYAVNARFSTPPGPTVAYDIVQVRRAP